LRVEIMSLAEQKSADFGGRRISFYLIYYFRPGCLQRGGFGFFFFFRERAPPFFCHAPPRLGAGGTRTTPLFFVGPPGFGGFFPFPPATRGKQKHLGKKGPGDFLGPFPPQPAGFGGSGGFREKNNREPYAPTTAPEINKERDPSSSPRICPPPPPKGGKGFPNPQKTKTGFPFSKWGAGGFFFLGGGAKGGKIKKILGPAPPTTRPTPPKTTIQFLWPPPEFRVPLRKKLLL